MAVQTAISIRVCPIGKHGKAIVHGGGQAAHRLSCGAQALQITQCFPIKLAYRVIDFVATLNWTGTSKFVQVIDHTTDWGNLSSIAIGIGFKDACVGIPFRVCVAAVRRVVSAVDVKCPGTYKLHGCAQNTAITAIAVAVCLIHQVAESRQSQLVAVFLNAPGRFVKPVGLLGTKGIIARVKQRSRRIDIANLDTGIEKTV